MGTSTGRGEGPRSADRHITAMQRNNERWTGDQLRFMHKVSGEGIFT